MNVSRSCLVVGLLSAFGGFGCSEPQADDRSPTVAIREPVSVHVAEVKTRMRPNALTLDGTLVADEQSNVTSVVSGRVVKVLVERGSKVEAGAPLVELRDVDYRLQAKAAKAQLGEARARLGIKNGSIPELDDMPEVAAARTEMELAAADLQRAEELAAAGAASSQALDAARARASASKQRYNAARNMARGAVASVQAARAALEQATTSASETTVRAPFAGEIADRMISVGEFVSPAVPLVRLVRTDPLRLELSVPQQHLQDVQPGQSVTVKVDALPNQTFDARVRYISAAVERDTRSLEVEALVPNPEGVLRPGLFATARLETHGEQEVAEIPSSAVYTEVGVSRVFVIADETVEERVVSITERTGDTVIVAEGLKSGERVAVDALDQLGDGVPVRIAAPEKLAES